MLFVFKINRTWLTVSFLITFILQTLAWGLVMEHIIPFETLFMDGLHLITNIRINMKNTLMELSSHWNEF